MLTLHFKIRGHVARAHGAATPQALFQLSAPVPGAAFRSSTVSGALSLRFRGNTRVEEACEMYTRAANMFKIAKNWSGEYSPRCWGGCVEGG